MNITTELAHRQGIAAGLMLVLAVNCSHAEAQGVAQDGGNVLSEVIVTATKRDELITDVPMAIQVIGAEAIENFGIDNFEEYAQYIPGLSFTKRHAGATHIVIRGLSTGNVGQSAPQNRSLVGVYLDDIPMQLNGYNFDPDMFDVARVEVLKGPQGTLFGDSAMAGAVRYVSSTPDLQHHAGRLNFQGSTTHEGGENYAVRGMINVPLAKDTLALRAVGWYSDADGWIDNIRTGVSDVNTEKTYGGRLFFLYQPTDNLSVNARILGQATSLDGRPETETNAGSGLRQNRDPEHFEDDAWLFNLTVNLDLKPGSLTFVSGYLDRYFTNAISGIERLVMAVFGPDGNLPNDLLRDPWKQEYLTQEIRFTTSGDRRVDYTAGIFLTKAIINYPTFGSADGFAQFAVDQGFAASLDELYALGCAPPEFPDHHFCGSLDTEQKQIAAFGDLTIHLSDRFDLLVGARYYDWEQEFIESYGGFFNGGPTFKRQVIKDDGINPRFGFTYGFGDDNLAFINAAKGFRLGGVNDPLPPLCEIEAAERGLTQFDRFDSDSLWTYEGGVKLLLADRRVLFNTSVFYTEWDDVQTTAGLDCGYAIITNSGNVESKGMEFDATIAASDNIRVFVSGSYTDAKLAEDSPNLGAQAGDQVPFVPKWKASAVASYSRPISEQWKGFVDVAFTAYGKSFTTFSPDDPSRIELPSSQVGTLRIGTKTERYRVALFADNLWDERAVNSSRWDFNDLITTYVRPRTIGIEFNAAF